ncbi:MAG: EAL domain-containing protein [Betaproteobacteria bacterium]|uniref:EAL domain-containing protein n=1 Tax=Candidatus Proximibacter danicus TaxID=2954365 RepID=A0A9D7PQX7_9PROT|nr:EAL domain-containing protein [Candidatus Proximibacter danicus]MBK9446109.1 EAL domain-containing protein [Betaproteobacteria bacterium]
MVEANKAQDQATRLLTLLAACTQLRAAAADTRVLIEQLCDALVHAGGYAVAAIRLTATHSSTEDPLRALRVAAGHASLLWSELEHLDEPALSLPLEYAGENHGLLRVAHTDGPFDAMERQVLAAIAADLAFSACALRTRDTHRDLDDQLRQLSRALESSSNGVMITSSTQLDHPIVYVNPAFERITGYSAAEVVGQSGRFLVRDDLAQKGLAEIRSALRDHREGHTVLRNYRKDGQLFWNELSIAPVLDESGQATTHFVSIINDVTERITYEQQLEYHATHDVLTGLANRNLLNDRIEQAILLARQNERLVGVLLLDLDRFKLINDGFGHIPADNLLKAVAMRLTSCVRDTDTVARLGGDEFVVVLSSVDDADGVASVAAKILRQLTLPLGVEGKDVFVTASIGIALYPRDGEHGEALLRNADVAMYRVKEHGRNNYRFYTPEMTHMALDRLDMESNLRRALERDEITVFYQPIVSLKTGTIVGAEALARWNHPRIGMIQPIEFIPLAEETGLIIPLGERILHQVCHQLAAWQRNGLPSIQVAINISARQFRQDNLTDLLRRKLAETGLEGNTLEFELTESMVMHDVENAIVMLRELKQLGVALALDDFGTGYSSLAYLKRFPIDALKIDRSFVRDIDTESDDAAIAHAVIAMAHSLGLRVIAEGVENAAQLNLLREYGCDDFQGFLFSRPVPAEEFALLLQNGRLLPPPAGGKQ